MKAKIKQSIEKVGKDKSRLMDILHEVQAEQGYISEDSVREIANLLGISKVDVEQTRSFYHFFTGKPVGKYAIYLNNSAVACMMGRDDIARVFEKEVGIPFNSVTPDGLIGLWDTSDIGMNDQEPAALINGVVFTKLTPSKVREILAGFKAGKEVREMVTKYGDSQNSQGLLKLWCITISCARGRFYFQITSLEWPSAGLSI